MKSKPVLLGLSFLLAASLACSLGARRSTSTPASTAATPLFGGQTIQPATSEAATSAPATVEVPTQVINAQAPLGQATIVPTLPAGLAAAGEVRQWAASATASTEYGNPEWAASQATGAPNVTECGDNTSAWASAVANTVDWLDLTYATPVKPYEIDIYQTDNPGQIVKVELISPDGQTVY